MRNMYKDLILGSATAMAAALRCGAIGAVDLLEQHFDRIDRVNPDINAIIWQDRDAARAVAQQCDVETARGRSRGPLHGVPVSVKESFDLAGAVSSWGDPAWKDNIATVDSDVVERLRAAGAVIFGKTNIPLKLREWQTFNVLFGTTNNPWNRAHVPGGSSGGAAAALATGMTALEVGSDIGASIRNPAHYCGVFGFKPTWNVISYQGHMAAGWYGDTDISVAGPLARSAEDLALGFDVIRGADRFIAPAWHHADKADDRDSVDLFRVALKLDDAVSPVDARYCDQLAVFAEKLTKAGASVTNAAPDLDSEAHFDLYLRLLGAATSTDWSTKEIEALRAAVEALNDPWAARIMETRLSGITLTHAEWLHFDNRRRIARQHFDRFFADYDVLIVPVGASSAFAHNQEGMRFERQLTINGHRQPEIAQLFWAGYSGVVGLPSVVGPMGFVDGLPVGYQAICGYGCDRTALAFARAVERQIGGFVPPTDYRVVL